jgi:hypothetical protein
LSGLLNNCHNGPELVDGRIEQENQILFPHHLALGQWLAPG